MEEYGGGREIDLEKIQLLKDKLKLWNKEVFVRIDLKLEEFVCDINLADKMLDTVSSSSFSDNLELRKEACCNFRIRFLTFFV